MAERGKMLGRLRSFGRCGPNRKCPGNRCAVCREFQADSIGRAAEKRQWKREVGR